MSTVKRKWSVFFDPERTHPWVARPETGAECFFITPEGLVRFLSDGGVNAQGITDVVKSLKSGRAISVELIDLRGK